MPGHTPIERQRATIGPGDPNAAIMQAIRGTFGQQLSQNLQQSGIPHGLIKSLSPGSLLSASGLGPAVESGIGGIEQALGGFGRIGIELLAGERGARGLQSLFSPEQNQTIDPQLAAAVGPQTQVQSPQIPAPQAAPTGPVIPPFQPITAPQLGDPRQGVPPDFSAARAALGPEVPAQQIGAGERLARGFGGMAGGGLAAIQGAPPGRAATTGEVIAGVGAGGGEALARLNAEDRQLQAFAQVSEQMRQKQLSAIELAEEASKAEQSQASADAWNRKEALQAQLDMNASLANLQAMRPVPTGNGVIIPSTGEFISTKRTTLVESLQAFLMLDKIEKIPLERTASVFGQKIFLENISSLMQVPVMAALQGLATPPAVVAFIGFLREENKDELANEVERLSQFTGGVTSDEQNERTASIAVTEFAHMILADLANPENPPFGFANEFIPLGLTMGGLQTSDQADRILQSLGGF